MPMWDVRIVSSGNSVWDMRIVSSGNSVYLGHDWSQFARTYDFGEGNLLIFYYDGAAVLSVTVFDPSTCRKEYLHTAGAGSSRGNVLHINEPTHFAVTLKQNQYLNVPVEFQEAHRYERSWKVVLRMGWRVVMDREPEAQQGPVGNRMVFKHRWHQFCIDNGLEVGDTWFFRVVRERKDYEEEEDDEEKEEEDDEHVLKVEVHKKDGAFVA